MRSESPITRCGSPDSTWQTSASALACAAGACIITVSSMQDSRSNSRRSRRSESLSIFSKIRMSSTSACSVREPCSTWRNSSARCSGLSACCIMRANPVTVVSGVRSSWLMRARNMLLARPAASARSSAWSSSRLRCSIWISVRESSTVASSTRRFCSALAASTRSAIALTPSSSSRISPLPVGCVRAPSSPPRMRATTSDSRCIGTVRRRDTTCASAQATSSAPSVMTALFSSIARWIDASSSGSKDNSTRPISSGASAARAALNATASSRRPGMLARTSRWNR